MTNYQGMLVSFEGIDFCGKSVQLELLVQKIVNLGNSVVVVREPGGTVISEKIRDVLLKKEHQQMNPVTEMLLYSAARAQLVQDKIIPHLKQGAIIVCDRYYDSTTAYQGYGRGIDLHIIEQINKLVTTNIEPNISYLIDIDVDEVEKRQLKMKANLDRIEEESKVFFNCVRKGYLEIARKNPQRFVIIDGMRSIPEIATEIWNNFRSQLQGGVYVFD